MRASPLLRGRRGVRAPARGEGSDVNLLYRDESGETKPFPLAERPQATIGREAAIDLVVSALDVDTAAAFLCQRSAEPLKLAVARPKQDAGRSLASHAFRTWSEGGGRLFLRRPAMEPAEHSAFDTLRISGAH